MKITLNDLVSSVESLRALLDCKLPFKISYRIAKLVNNKIQSELNIYDEQRNKLITELGEKQEDGTFQVKDAEQLKVFSEKMKELLAVEVELDWEKLSVDDLGDIKLEARHVVDWLFN